MISLFFSSASNKAWVSGLIAALLTPAYELLRSGGEITPRTVAVAVFAGLFSAGAVFGVSNADAPAQPAQPAPVAPVLDDTPGRHEGPDVPLG